MRQQAEQRTRVGSVVARVGSAPAKRQLLFLRQAPSATQEGAAGPPHPEPNHLTLKPAPAPDPHPHPHPFTPHLPPHYPASPARPPAAAQGPPGWTPALLPQTQQTLLQAPPPAPPPPPARALRSAGAQLSWSQHTSIHSFRLALHCTPLRPGPSQPARAVQPLSALFGACFARPPCTMTAGASLHPYAPSTSTISAAACLGGRTSAERAAAQRDAHFGRPAQLGSLSAAQQAAARSAALHRVAPLQCAVRSLSLPAPVPRASPRPAPPPHDLRRCVRGGPRRLAGREVARRPGLKVKRCDQHKVLGAAGDAECRCGRATRPLRALPA